MLRRPLLSLASSVSLWQWSCGRSFASARLGRVLVGRTRDRSEQSALLMSFNTARRTRQRVPIPAQGARVPRSTRRRAREHARFHCPAALGVAAREGKAARERTGCSSLVSLERRDVSADTATQARMVRSPLGGKRTTWNGGGKIAFSCVSRASCVRTAVRYLRPS